MQAEEGMRSASSGSFTPSYKGEWEHAISFDKQTLRIIAIPALDKKQVKFTVQIDG
jgi:hypothetical protein